METPEKIYILPRQGGDYAPYWKTDGQDGFGIEYIRTDAIIEKACNFIDERLIFDDNAWYIEGEVTVKDKVIEDFKNYMKG